MCKTSFNETFTTKQSWKKIPKCMLIYFQQMRVRLETKIPLLFAEACCQKVSNKS